MSSSLEPSYGRPIFWVATSSAMVMLPSVLQPAGFRVDWQVAVQQLFIDHDIDAFLAKSDELTVDYYN